MSESKIGDVVVSIPQTLHIEGMITEINEGTITVEDITGHTLCLSHDKIAYMEIQDPTIKDLDHLKKLMSKGMDPEDYRRMVYVHTMPIIVDDYILCSGFVKEEDGYTTVNDDEKTYIVFDNVIRGSYIDSEDEEDWESEEDEDDDEEDERPKKKGEKVKDDDDEEEEEEDDEDDEW